MEKFFLKVPVKYIRERDEEEKRLSELTGIESEPNIKDGWTYVNVDHIASFNEAEDGYTFITLSSGEFFSAIIKFEDFKKLLTKDEDE